MGGTRLELERLSVHVKDGYMFGPRWPTAAPRTIGGVFEKIRRTWLARMESRNMRLRDFWLGPIWEQPRDDIRLMSLMRQAGQ